MQGNICILPAGNALLATSHWIHDAYDVLSLIMGDWTKLQL